MRTIGSRGDNATAIASVRGMAVVTARRGAPIVLTMASAFLLSGCSALSRGFLAAAGPVAAGERHEFFVVSAIMVLVIAPVLLLTPIMAWHYRLANTKTAFRPQWGFSWILEGLIWIPPTIIVIVLSVFLVGATYRFDPYRPVSPDVTPLQVQAVSLNWKWLFIYPSQHVALVNELVLPAGRPVHISLTSGTVMQSLLMPQLAGQIYAMAGMKTQLNLEITQPGSYWGEDAQFDGDGFEKQKFQVMGITPADFASWVTATQRAPQSLDAAAYHNLSRQSVLSRPITFGQVDAGIFGKIVAQTIQPGYLSEPKDGK